MEDSISVLPLAERAMAGFDFDGPRRFSIFGLMLSLASAD
jgi:hypothetical protein